MHRMLSPELETLDQLVGGDLQLPIIRRLYPDTQAFMRGVLGLLSSGDVCLITNDGSNVPQWRWRELFVNGAVMNSLSDLALKITEQGIRRIG